MENSVDPKNNYEESRKKVGWVPLNDAKQEDWDRIGFMSGLEVHQQLLTDKKLFCRCPAGVFQGKGKYHAELIRHMRPTLSELGEYDGTALMEFKTRKEIVYRIANETACTYDVDDTPPFKLNQQALERALVISLLCKLNIVGEVHITRKQYLDGSIPTGFQRTAILGVEGEIPLKNKKVRLIQLSIEEDSCREVSDIGHTRIYTTDRLGMPLIETVTYPDMANPFEVKEACDYIRFMNRSTGLVRTGPGAGREDVNVSCKGGTRVEIKGVSHTRWIPKLTHNEAFRQWALLQVRDILKSKFKDVADWKLTAVKMEPEQFKFSNLPFENADHKMSMMALNLPGFKGILSYFTQPGKMFADEISDRLKVIACIEKPNMSHSEEFEPIISNDDFSNIQSMLKAGKDDAQVIFWGPEADMKTALDTVEERCKLAFEGVPNETRKSFENGTTIFERVLPGADRMYPDTDSKPIPLENEFIDGLRKQLPTEVMDRYQTLKKWNIPEDCYAFILKKNLFPIIETIITDLGYDPKFTGVFVGHALKFTEGHYRRSKDFSFAKMVELFKFVKEQKLDKAILRKMLPVIYEHPKMDFDSVLETLKFKRIKPDEIVKDIPFLKKQFAGIRYSKKDGVETHWIMGELHKRAEGNMALSELRQQIEKASK
jgi:glutamyl-tRNA(Gln) amidotransferase subunit E